MPVGPAMGPAGPVRGGSCGLRGLTCDCSPCPPLFLFFKKKFGSKKSNSELLSTVLKLTPAFQHPTLQHSPQLQHSLPLPHLTLSNFFPLLFCFSRTLMQLNTHFSPTKPFFLISKKFSLLNSQLLPLSSTCL